MAVRLAPESASPSLEIGFGEQAELDGHAGNAWRFGLTRVRGEIVDARMRSLLAYARLKLLLARCADFPPGGWSAGPQWAKIPKRWPKYESVF